VVNADCGACHNSVAWLPATFDHSLGTGVCSSCHNNIVAVGKPSNHFDTSKQCDECHTNQSWLPAIYNHNSSDYPGGHAGVDCVSCHTGNVESITWPTIKYRPDCAGCHETAWIADPHKKTENPSLILYTLDELSDCTTSCHIYADDTFSPSAIAEVRNSKHTPSDGAF
jgi:hypothetical protein